MKVGSHLFLFIFLFFTTFFSFYSIFHRFIISSATFVSKAKLYISFCFSNPNFHMLQLGLNFKHMQSILCKRRVGYWKSSIGDQKSYFLPGLPLTILELHLHQLHPPFLLLSLSPSIWTKVVLIWWSAFLICFLQTRFITRFGNIINAREGE